MSERDLPVTGGGAGDAPEAHQPPAWRLVTTLGAAAVLAGLAIVLVYRWAQPRIRAHQAERLRQAVQQVLGEPDSYRPMYVWDGAVRDSLPPGADSTDAETVYAGFDDAGGLVGYAVAGQKPGYQDVVRLIFGYDPGRDLVLGMKVLESKETPGLGAKITSDSSFLREFRGIEPPLEGVKEDAGDPHEVDMITGATISSETVIEIINERLRALGPALRGRGVAGRPATAGRGERETSATVRGRGTGTAGGTP